ncbi:MAG: hypothetical protein JST85_19005 [Acidobacteria bacterium]|nr:hypothetical protein [Acidobacteriota bacterium]
MPKFIHICFLVSRLSRFCLAALCLASMISFNALSQINNQPKEVFHLPDKLGENFRATGKPKSLSADKCFSLPDGEIYKEFRLENLTSETYTDGKNSILVEVFQTQFDADAFGLFTFNREENSNSRFSFFNKRFFVRLSSDSLKSFALDPIIQTIKDALTSSNGDLSPLPSHLPAEGKLAGSEKYLLGPAALSNVQEFADLKETVNFSGGAEVTLAKYQTGISSFSLMIVEYHTPQLATDGYTQFQTYFDKFPEQEKKQRLLKRVGNYIVITTAAQDLASAEKIVSEVKYTPVIYWEARKITDLPIAFRPPDPLAMEEASQTANMLIRTFYWIGVMLFGAITLGIISGGIFFYWNRYRRRKLGLDEMFSDAGGTVRLNLDDYLLPSLDPARKKVEEDGHL